MQAKLSIGAFRLVQEMLALRPAVEDERPMFTAGWTVGPTNLGTPGFNCNGSMEGTTAFLAILPERQTAVALLANERRISAGDCSHRVSTLELTLSVSSVVPCLRVLRGSVSPCPPWF